MKVNGIIAAQAVRVMPINSSGIFIPDLVRGLWHRYHFVRVPVTTDDLLAADRPLLFEHGKFEAPDGREVVIRTLRVSAQGLVAETQTSTDDSLQFLDDAIQWAVENSIIPKQGYSTKIFVSQVEVVLEGNFERIFPQLDPVGDEIAKFLSSKEAPCSPLRVYSVAMNIDPRKINLPEFRLERRAEIPYEQSTFFSQAPLTTADHLALLSRIEAIMRSVDFPHAAPNL